MKLSLSLVVILALAAGLAGFKLTGNSLQWKANAVYTVAPKTTSISPDGVPSGLAYTDIQAANLFIDVIRSWVLAAPIREELSQRYPGTYLTDLPHLSMQTFTLQVIAPQADAAKQGLLLADSALQRELNRYNQSGQMTQYSAYRGEVTVSKIVRHPGFNGALAGLITLIVGIFFVLSLNYYQKVYAHRR